MLIRWNSLLSNSYKYSFRDCTYCTNLLQCRITATYTRTIHTFNYQLGHVHLIRITLLLTIVLWKTICKCIAIKLVKKKLRPTPPWPGNNCLICLPSSLFENLLRPKWRQAVIEVSADFVALLLVRLYLLGQLNFFFTRNKVYSVHAILKRNFPTNLNLSKFRLLFAMVQELLFALRRP